MSKIAKHTPGPWHVGTGCPGESFLAVYDESCICVALAWRSMQGPPPTQEQAKANARLIAAAPDLLAACKAARAFGSQGDTHEGLSVSEMLRAAISKAEPA